MLGTTGNFIDLVLDKTRNIGYSIIKGLQRHTGRLKAVEVKTDTLYVSPCPFCGTKPEKHGQAHVVPMKGIHLAGEGQVIDTVKHTQGGCCLSSLIFRLDQWNTRTKP